MTEDNEEVVITEAQLEAMFDIARMFGGEMLGVTRSKKHRQRLWRATGVLIDYASSGQAKEVTWSITPDGKAVTAPLEGNNTVGFKRFRWRRLKEGE